MAHQARADLVRYWKQQERDAIARGASRAEVWLAGHALPTADRNAAITPTDDTQGAAA